ncbi:MAG: YkgJ family cysteine cluster protein [Spirochaetaceae bacterium]|jgi:Fe-S-cluster containining protein|nr:YkgJ family cysteine cluster protein [Spirochaetaceae bacterium]
MNGHPIAAESKPSVMGQPPDYSEPWYAGGLHFSCVRCSVCCRHESGYVLLSHSDLRALAGFCRLSPAVFAGQYCRWVTTDGGKRLSLQETAVPNGYDCVFWKGGCTVYAARPCQCRTYPFWPYMLLSREMWEAAAKDCPGTRQPALVDFAAIQRNLIDEAENQKNQIKGPEELDE